VWDFFVGLKKLGENSKKNAIIVRNVYKIGTLRSRSGLLEPFWGLKNPRFSSRIDFLIDVGLSELFTTF